MATREGLDLFAELPRRPTPTAEAMARFDSEDWTENFFEWHRTTAGLAFVFAYLKQESPAARRIDRLKFTILTALLSRCALDDGQSVLGD